MIRVEHDPHPHTTAGAVRLVIGPACHRLTLAEAHELHEQLGGVLMAAEPCPDTERPMPPEPITKPATPIPIKRASGEHRLTLPHGIQAEVDAILEEGKGPPK